MITLDLHSSNIVRFCKNHKIVVGTKTLRTTGSLEENIYSLRILCGEWLGCDPEYTNDIDDASMVSVMMQIAEKLEQKEQVYKAIPKFVTQSPWANPSPFSRFMNEMISIFGCMRVIDDKDNTLIEFTPPSKLAVN